MGQRSAPPTRQTKTCSYYGLGGFVWYKTKAGRYMLAEPHPGTFDANPRRIHLCPARRMDRALRRASNGTVGRHGTRSEKPSTWRRRSRRR